MYIPGPILLSIFHEIDFSLKPVEKIVLDIVLTNSPCNENISSVTSSSSSGLLCSTTNRVNDEAGLG